MSMTELDEIIARVESEERELRFSSFTPETALEIGLLLADRARREKIGISTDIRVNGHEWFHYSAPGTAPNNDEWMRMKRNTVNRYGISSYLFSLRMKKYNGTMLESKLDEYEYAQCGGGFPIHVTGVGVVGVMCVSGLRDDEDHALIVWALREALAKQK